MNERDNGAGVGKRGSIRKEITRNDVERAVRKFIASGQLIVHLPEEQEPPRNMVGAKHGEFVPLFENY